MPWLKCKICNKDFYAKPRHIKIGWGKYCSKKCHYLAQRSGRHVKCSTCGQKVYRSKTELRCSKSKKFFCNKSCFAVWKNQHLLYGKKHANWKNGENAYRAIIIRAKIKPVCRVCKNNDQRVLVVHHVDKNRQHNSIKNLIWLCRNCHCLVHNHNQKIE